MSIRTTKQGKNYAVFYLLTQEGSIPCKAWNIDRDKLPFDDGDVIQMTGAWDNYEGSPSMVVTDSQKKNIPADAFYPTVPNRDELEQRLCRMLGTLAGPLRGAVEAVLFHSNLKAKFLAAPAATGNHHAKVGGLLKHTVDVMSLTSNLCSDRHDINVDLAMVGAALHDVGKTQEYDPKPPFRRTTEGRLLGHIALGIRILDLYLFGVIRQTMPTDYLRLQHIILAHHGKLEWGSPVEPQTAEALVVFHADYADAYTEGACEALALRRNDGWTPPVPILGGRQLYAPDPQVKA